MGRKMRYDEESRAKLARLMMVLGEAYGKKISADLIRVYEMGLHDIDIDTVQRKAMAHLREGRWFPKVSELRPSKYRELWHRNLTRRQYERINDARHRDGLDPIKIDAAVELIPYVTTKTDEGLPDQ